MEYQIHTLHGLRLLTLPSASQVVYCGIVVAAGTRHEQPGEEGLAHFCEHLAFKGTHRRTAVQIINALEGVGGELNAYTTKEYTLYYATVTRDHLSRALDVLTDIVFHSQYPQQEVEKEQEVVCDEIESYEDTPAELIFDEFENILFEGHPLGHNILGTSEQVRRYRQEDAQRFAHRYYRPDNCVLFVSGGGNDVTRLLKKAVDSAEIEQPQSPLAAPGVAQPASPLPSDIVVRRRGTHQAHVMLGTRTFPDSDPRRWTLFLLNNILGGPGMNSRLNLSLRERRALVYTIESQMVCYSDTGLWSVYFGCDPADVKRCLRLVRSEMERLCKHRLSPTQLRNAKRQLRGQLVIGTENREQFVLDCAKNFLFRGRPLSVEEVLEKVEAVTADDLLTLATELFRQENLVTLIYQ